MTKEEIVTALRQCPRYGVDCDKGVCAFFKPNGAFGDCIKKKNDAAADLIENQQREIEALRQANEGLRWNLAATGRADVGAVKQVPLGCIGPYEATTDGNPDGDEIFRAALETFGAEAQVMMAIEEMSELMKELCKHHRGHDNVKAIAEEITDVEIMLRQMMMLYGCAESVETFRRYKLERLTGRIKEVKEHKHE